jgi:hypothetical protein
MNAPKLRIVQPTAVKIMQKMTNRRWFVRCVQCCAIVTAILFCHQAHFAHAQSASSPEPAELRVNALLWKIEGNGLKTASYLFGTIHLICEHDVVMSKATRRAFAQSKQLAMEIDMGKVDENLMSLLDKGAMMRGDTTLEMLLDTADMALVTNFFRDSLGTPFMPPMNRIKPTFLSTMLLQGEQDCEQTSYEEEFVALARRQKKPTLGIETVEEQLALFDYLTYKQQAEMLVNELKSSINASSQDNNSMQRVTELYKQGKITELLELLRSEEAENFEEILLNKRNRAWIPILERIIQKKSTFIAVGAGHLAGMQGVINLLRKRGYALTPMK